MSLKWKLIALLELPLYVFRYYGGYYYTARIGLLETYWIWRVIEWEAWL